MLRTVLGAGRSCMVIILRAVLLMHVISAALGAVLFSWRTLASTCAWLRLAEECLTEAAT